MKLFHRTIRDLHQMLRDREISSVELTQSVLDQIQAVGDRTKAYLLVTKELALRQAHAADERLRSKRDVRPMTGIPIALKDVLCVKDVASTAGSKILKGFTPPYSATVVERLEAEGAYKRANVKSVGVSTPLITDVGSRLQILDLSSQHLQIIVVLLVQFIGSFREFSFETKPSCLLVMLMLLQKEPKCFFSTQLSDSGEVLHAETIQNLRPLKVPFA